MDIERIQTNADDAARMEFLDRASIAFMQGYVANCQVPVGVGHDKRNQSISDNAYAIAQAMWDARQALFFKGES